MTERPIREHWFSDNGVEWEFPSVPIVIYTISYS